MMMASGHVGAVLTWAEQITRLPQQLNNSFNIEYIYKGEG